MLGATSPIATVLGSAPAPTAPAAALKSFVRAATSVGLHLLLIEPYGKKPVDMRTVEARRRDDKAAKEAARTAGRADWDKAKSKGGVFLATDDPVKLNRWIDAYRKKYESDYDENCPVNFAVAVGPSRLIVADCDTAAQVDAFLADAGVPGDIPPTVKTPGQVDTATGEWAHSDGGHYYFTVPADMAVPEYAGSYTAPGGYVLLWADRYVLIPPSIREEGPYRLLGQDFPAPAWMLETIDGYVERKVRRTADHDSDVQLVTAVDTWAESVTWADILAPAGWSPTARPDNCGCDIWTAPGDHGSPKSATAHDGGCTLGRYTTVNAPLHIWTDYPGPELEAWISEKGSKTLSRLQTVAALYHGGDLGATMRERGVLPEAGAGLGFGSPLADDLGISAANLSAAIPLPSNPPTGGTVTFHGPGGDQTVAYDAPAADIQDAIATASAQPGDLFVIAGGSADPDPGPVPDPESTARPDGLPDIRPFSQWRDMPAPEFVVDGLLEHRGLTALVGPPGVGKSSVALDIAAAICLGRRWMGRATMRQPVMYLPGEGMAGSVQRLLAWEAAHDDDLGEDLYLGDNIIQVAASADAWSAMLERIIRFRVGLLIIDTFARATVGLEENSATDIGKAVARLDIVRKATGAGVMVVHHTGKNGSTRGSSALNGALDTELTVKEATWDDSPTAPYGRQLELDVSKQKNAATPDNAIPLLASPYNGSVVITGPGGIVDDPLDGVRGPRAVIPEPTIEIAVRLWTMAAGFPQQGVTRGELAYGCPMDAATARRLDAKTAWKLRVSEAVDLAIRLNLLETLTGTPTGARYIQSTSTPDQARAVWAANTMQP